MEEEFKKLENDGDESWVKHFENILSKSRLHSCGVGGKGLNKLLNRYVDVLPYDHARVKLGRINQTTDYINANLVTVPKAARQYILTQGPLPDTLSHFWLMVWEQKSNVIVMLNRIYEMEEFKKCEQYWPTSRKSLHYDDVNLTVTAKSFHETKHYCVREMVLTDDETNKSRVVTQFHYTAWPDHGQPDSPTSFLRLLSAIRKSGGLDKMDEPTIVHCSAGIGRSGTFCLIDSILTMVENQGSTEGIDIVNNLIEMRDYRKGLIQTPVQLRFSYMTIIYGIKILEKANKLNPHISSNRAFDNVISQPAQNSNGSAQAINGGKKLRRNRKKQSTTTSSSLSSLNVFKKHLLVDALDDIDSDSADDLFYQTMKPLPSMKKPRNSLPEDFNNSSLSGQPESILHKSSNGQPSSPLGQYLKQHDDVTEKTAKSQLLTNAINSLLTDRSISKNHNDDTSPLLVNASVSETADSSLLRRRERELKNLKLAEKTMEIKNKMKAIELEREFYTRRMALFKKTAIVGGVAALALGSVLYFFRSM